MLNCTEGYRSAIAGSVRQMLIKAVFDLISPDTVYGAVTAQSSCIYNKPQQLHNKNFGPAASYATLEPSRWVLDGTWMIYPDHSAELTGEVGYQSGFLSGEGGDFLPAQWVEMSFSGVSVLQACSVYFPGGADGVAADFTVEVKQGGTAYFSKSYTGSWAEHVSLDGFTVYNPDAIRVTVTKWSRPGRRMRVLEIVPGVYEEWDQHIVCDLSIVQQVNFACTALPYGTATLKMDNLDRRFEPRRKNGLFQSIEERQGIPISIGVRLADGTVEYKQVGVFYQYSGGWKTGDNGLSMQWDLVDIIGLLANRSYIVPDPMPTTLSGWAADLVGQLGVNFAGRYKINTNYANTSMTATAASLSGKRCGDILRYICMAAGCYPFADAYTGMLAIEPVWSGGDTLTLDNMSAYPVMRANDDVAYIQMKVYGSTVTTYKLSGNNAASSNTVHIDNPFIHTTAQALAAGKNILSCYGGNRIEVSGRGNPASECGDVDIVELDESTATSARRLSQQFAFTNGIMRDLPVTLLQADGSLLYNVCVVLTGSGTWTAPSGKTALGIILVGGGDGGQAGEDGGWSDAGADGSNGKGGKVYAANISINNGQTFTYTCGSGGAANGGLGGATSFGTYSSANGTLFDGYTDIRSGEVYGRDGVALPLIGSGDGGKGGKGGVKGNEHEERRADRSIKYVVDNPPGTGASGAPGGSGCIIIWFEK